MQKAGRLKKCYIVEVYGDIAYRIKKYGFIINSPIFHRKDDPQRMWVLWGHVSKEQNSPLLYSETEIVEYEYSLLTMTSMLLVEIRKGVRHQIRVHLSSIGYPIVGDLLYGKKKDPQKWNLQLFSVGLSSIN